MEENRNKVIYLMWLPKHDEQKCSSSTTFQIRSTFTFSMEANHYEAANLDKDDVQCCDVNSITSALNKRRKSTS